jgi:hypothetical protein
MHLPEPLSCLHRRAALWLVLICLVAGMSSCGTYHKVAVWYKYRKDFHLAKKTDAADKTGAVTTIAAPGSAVALADAPAHADAAAKAERRLAQAARKELRKEHRVEKRARLRQALVERKARLLERYYASTTPGTETASSERLGFFPRQSVWERSQSEAKSPAELEPIVTNRPYSWAAIVGFASALAAIPALYLGAAVFAAFWVCGLVFSIIGLVKAGKRKAYRGQGFAIAGLSISAAFVLALILLIILIIALFASDN